MPRALASFLFLFGFLESAARAQESPGPLGTIDTDRPAGEQRGTGRRTEPVEKIVLDEDWPEEDS
mgnify:CR=1 FL=1